MEAIAFYLPQFHPTPDNDEFWEPGFTEWTNVVRARRLFPGHRQPRVPSELGFYDLRDPEVRTKQAELARSHGITAFCYWHYWFGGGRRTLERPFAEVLESGSPDFRFCLGWANETWKGEQLRRHEHARQLRRRVRAEDARDAVLLDAGIAEDLARQLEGGHQAAGGGPGRILVEQRYPGVDDERAHFELVLEAFRDPRYVRVEGRPFFLVYNPHLLPDAEAFARRWRAWAAEAGLPGLFLAGMERPGWRPTQSEFDAVVMGQTVPPSIERRRHQRLPVDRVLSAITNRTRVLPGIYSYRRWSRFIPHLHPDASQLSFPTVLPGWDNTPRMGRGGKVFVGATPERFGEPVAAAVRLLEGRPEEHKILFVKSWNEWAEGNYLEPDERDGRAFLEAFRDAAETARTG